MNIGEAIKTLRTQQGMTQAQLGDRIGMSTNGVSNIETGKAFPPKGTMKRICVALGIPTSYLLLASIEEEDVPEAKRRLYKALLEPFRRELLETGKL